MFKNVRKEEITIPAQMSYLIQVREFIEHIGRRFKFDDKITNSFKLVVDEACTNVIRHGYRDIKNGEITIKAIVRRLSLTIIIIDQGHSYDPRQANTPDLEKYVAIGKKGGLGILMMRKLMDDMQYVVTERGNEFRLTKYRETSHESLLKQRWNALNMKVRYSVVAFLAYTFLAFIVFVPLFFSIEKNVREEVLNRGASAGKALAENVVNDMLNDDSALLFEKSYSVLNNNRGYVQEVFVLDTEGNKKAWGNTAINYAFEKYTRPENSQLADTIASVTVFRYERQDSLIYDLSTDILLAEDAKLGAVHIWVNNNSIVQKANRSRLKMIIVLALVLVFGYTLLFILIQRILSSFHSLADWVRQVVHGKVDQDEIDIDASDEIGEIAQAFNEMTNKFREAQVNLIEQQKLQKELQVAQEIQQMLLPSDFPEVEGYEIASFYEAAKEVGGDLFDFVDVDDNTIGICVADVSGKGVPGSLIMTMIRTALRLESRGNHDPADVLSRVNRFVADDMKRGMFVTMFYIILDSRNRIIRYASAGHNPMILYRGSTRQTYYLNPSGFPVGIQLPDLELFSQKIETDSIRLREDDILVLYTDGITEAMNSKRELFREERFLEAIRKNAHLDVGEFIKSINVEVKSFTGGAPQNDDITYVAIKEKMMSGEVIFNLQKELFKMIKRGVKVKDALKKLNVSPNQYYKYKEIIERKGMDGLRVYLEEQDFVEKKHLSIEVKTKIFDIIRKHPDYGPRLIAYKLREKEYGELRIDPDRIYDELVKLRLNTETFRRRYLQKGTTRRIKQPGTPLLTLDGQVIINFESAEKEIEKRTGKTMEDLTGTPPSAQKEEVEPKSLELTTPVAPKKPARPESTAEQEQGPAAAASAEPGEKETRASVTVPEEPAVEEVEQEEESPEVEKPAEAAMVEIEVETGPEPEAEEAERVEESPEVDKPVETSEVEIEVETGPEPEAEEAERDEESSEVDKPAETSEVEIEVETGLEPEPQPITREELEKSVELSIDQEKLDLFYDFIDTDLSIIADMGDQIAESGVLEKDIKKLNLKLKIILKHPILKELPDVKHIFGEVQQTLAFAELRFNELESELIRENVKDLLKYLQKDHKFDDNTALFEAINEIGRIHYRLAQSVAAQGKQQTKKISRIREKLAQKHIVSDSSLLEPISKEQEK